MSVEMPEHVSKRIAEMRKMYEKDPADLRAFEVAVENYFGAIEYAAEIAHLTDQEKNDVFYSLLKSEHLSGVAFPSGRVKVYEYTISELERLFDVGVAA